MHTNNLPSGKLRYTLTNDYLFHIVFQRNTYIDVMPTIHIGILDFTLFPEYPEFYARYAMKNIKNDNIYSDKLLLNVLDLNQMHRATKEDIQSGLAHWARLFKAETWEDLKMLASEYRDFEDITDTMQQALEDKKIRLQCEARERYERDRTSLYNCGKRDGISEGIEKLINILQKVGTSKEIAKEQLIEQYKLSEAEADKKLDLYWK